MTEIELTEQYLDAQRGAIGSLLIDAPAVAGMIFTRPVKMTIPAL